MFGTAYYYNWFNLQDINNDPKLIDMSMCADLQTGLTPSLQPEFGRYSVDELRRRLPGWIALDHFGAPEILSVESRPARLFAMVDEAAGRRGDPRETERFTLTTPAAEFDLHLIEPRGESQVDRVVIFQHGHEGINLFLAWFGDVVDEIVKRGIPAVFPIQPHTDFCDEYAVTHKLYMLERTMTGMRVYIEQRVLDWVEDRYPDAEIVYAGHSGGAVWGYYTSVVDGRIDALARDYHTVPETMFSKYMHCETFPGIYHFFHPNRSVRDDVPRAPRHYTGGHMYPDRRELLSFLLNENG